MKNKLWLIQVPVILLFAAAFCVSELGAEGRLQSGFLQHVYEHLSRASAFFTDLKFQIRGPRPPKNKIVIVAVDSPSIATLGRWPWSRDLQATLIDSVFKAGAKAVGLDIVYSEPEKAVPDDLSAELRKRGLGGLLKDYQVDDELASIVHQYSDRLVLGWTTEETCQPLYASKKECNANDPGISPLYTPEFRKFAISDFRVQGKFDREKTPFLSVGTPIINIDRLNRSAVHSGHLEGLRDVDAYFRRTDLFLMGDGLAYPSMALELARTGLGEDLFLSLSKRQRVNGIGFAHSGRKIPVSPLGAMQINFRGGAATFPYISALDVLRDAVGSSRSLSSEEPPIKKLLKDAFVLIGVTATGAHDLRAWPFERNGPGVEIHANVLDNILSGDPLVSGAGGIGAAVILLLMLFGAAGFASVTQKLEAIPALAFFLAVFVGLGLLDTKVLFAHDFNWNTSFLFLELFSLFFLTLAAKYVMEEQKKKFIRSAFTKYVAPVVVDSILKDPENLSLGGEKKNLTILFSDIRNFTGFSETMDAKTLATFLNDYLGIMTDIVFEHNGTLDKYIGDAIMAFWGAPLDQKGHAEAACKAAIAMMKALDAHRARFKSQYGIDVNVGIGINSGIVNVGNLGSERSFEYTVIGDHVNLASRIEGVTKTYRAAILTSRFTFDELEASQGAIPPHRVLDLVKVKGKQKAIELIEVFHGEPSKAGLRSFEEARAFYLARDFDRAIAKFREASELLAANGTGPDGPCEALIERCEELKKSALPPDWDGSYEMHSK